MSCFITHYASPLGRLLLAADEEGLTGLWLEGQKYFAAGLPQQREEQRTPALEEACRWLDTTLPAGSRILLPPLHPVGSDFQRAVGRFCCRWADHHHLWRAGRGTGAAARPDIFRRRRWAAPWGIPCFHYHPCHRVVGSGGSLTGYAGGLENKIAADTGRRRPWRSVPANQRNGAVKPVLRLDAGDGAHYTGRRFCRTTRQEGCTMKQYHIVDLFAGVGGLSYGFSQLPGFRILAANEIERTLQRPIPSITPGVKMLNCDIADLTKERLAGALGGQQVDIVGGPPCQSYSTLGKRRMDDRANLFLQYKRILQILQPQAFIFENVTGILSMDHGRLFQRVESEFRALGYDAPRYPQCCRFFGVPQQRERVILVGMKGENNYIFPVPTHGPGKKPYVTLRDAIGDLPQLKSGEVPATTPGSRRTNFCGLYGQVPGSW